MIHDRIEHRKKLYVLFAYSQGVLTIIFSMGDLQDPINNGGTLSKRTICVGH